MLHAKHRPLTLNMPPASSICTFARRTPSASRRAPSPPHCKRARPRGRAGPPLVWTPRCWRHVSGVWGVCGVSGVWGVCGVGCVCAWGWARRGARPGRRAVLAQPPASTQGHRGGCAARTGGSACTRHALTKRPVGVPPPRSGQAQREPRVAGGAGGHAGRACLALHPTGRQQQPHPSRGHGRCAQPLAKLLLQACHKLWHVMAHNVCPRCAADLLQA